MLRAASPPLPCAKKALTGMAGSAEGPRWAILRLSVVVVLAALLIWLAVSAYPGSFPFWASSSAGNVNFHVLSGWGQWAVQIPVVLPAAEALGLDTARAAIVWGNAWTDMIQPIWALPLLGTASPGAYDITGFSATHLPVGGAVIIIGLTFP